MGLDPKAPKVYEGPPHAWAVPDPREGLAVVLFGVAAFVVCVELFFVAAEWWVYGYILPGTARAFGAVGVLLLIVANAKSVALALHKQSADTLEGLVEVALRRLWRAHFWLNPVAVFSLGLFLLFAPVPQPPFYHVAYGILLWQNASGLLAREALPLRGRTESTGVVARAAHHQPSIYVVLTVLVLAGFVDSLFP